MKKSFKLLCFLIPIIIILIVVASLICSFIFPFPKHVIIDDPGKYGEYDSFVDKKINGTFGNSLPKSLPEEYRITDYVYDFNYVAFEDPSFHIGLEISYTEDAFEKEYSRISNFDDVVVVDTKNVSLMILSDCGSIREFCDTSSWIDGYYHSIEIVEFDKNDNNVRYLVAYVSDTSSIESDYMELVTATYGQMN